MVACSPHVFNAEETLSSLRFGQRAKTIVTKISKNEERSPEEMKELIKQLKHELQHWKDFSAKLQARLEALGEKVENAPAPQKEGEGSAAPIDLQEEDSSQLRNELDEANEKMDQVSSKLEEANEALAAAQLKEAELKKHLEAADAAHAAKVAELEGRYQEVRRWAEDESFYSTFPLLSCFTVVEKNGT